MPAILKSNTTLTIRPRMVPVSPFQLYLEQVKGVSDSYRASRAGLSYYPSQFGGLKGQRLVLADQPVLQLIDFKNPN